MIIKAPALVTAEELLRMPNSVDYELVDGVLVERNMGAESDALAVELIFLFGEFFKKNGRCGNLFPGETGFRIFPDRPNLVRKPDVAFVRLGRFPDNRRPRGYVDLAPDLAVEVISPNDLAREVNEKIDEYLSAGVSLVWVIDPDTKSVSVYRKNGTTARLRGDDELSGEEIVPGFCCKVSDIFADVIPSEE